MMLGRLKRAMAMSAPGMFLSQPTTEMLASYHMALATVSMESAIRSRDCREKFMPSVPMEMPSLTPMVWNIRPTIPFAFTRFLISLANPFRCMLHGLPSQPVLAMPTCALCMSSSVRPMAWSMALEPGCDTISVRRELYLLSLGVLDMMELPEKDVSQT